MECFPEPEKHHHQNYLVLCPNHAAMFIHANASKDDMKDVFLALDGNELGLTLADQLVFVYFTDTHIKNLKIVIEADSEG